MQIGTHPVFFSLTSDCVQMTIASSQYAKMNISNIQDSLSSHFLKEKQTDRNNHYSQTKEAK